MAAADRLDFNLRPAATDVDLGIDADVDLEDQLATRAAWLYFVAENTQQQIGQRLGLTRAKVNRLLAHARRQGLVQFTITGRLAASIKLEEALKKRFQLVDAVVVPSSPEVERQRAVIASAAGRYLAQQLRDDMAVGVGWGQTLRLSLSSVPHKNYKGLSVVSLLGGLTHSSAVNPHETASHLADIVGGQCYYFAGPAFTDTEASREVLMKQPMLRDVYERGRRVDLAFLSVGELGQNSTMAKLGLITPQELETLQNSGAVGDLCSHWLDAEGQSVDHPLNRRAVALAPQLLRNVPRVVLVSGGKNKVVMMRGVLLNTLANIVITDEATAQALIDHD
jgi:DNA-binding transcriptional regulator LsrR (DeoR family)